MYKYTQKSGTGEPVNLQNQPCQPLNTESKFFWTHLPCRSVESGAHFKIRHQGKMSADSNGTNKKFKTVQFLTFLSLPANVKVHSWRLTSVIRRVMSNTLLMVRCSLLQVSGSVCYYTGSSQLSQMTCLLNLEGVPTQLKVQVGFLWTEWLKTDKCMHFASIGSDFSFLLFKNNSI